MARIPKLEPQLDGSPTQATDCGRAVVVMAVDFATQGGRRPTTEAIGIRMGKPSGPTTTADAQRAVLSYDKPAETAGRHPLRYVRHVASPWGDAVDALEAGHFLQLQIDYGVVADRRPDLWASRTFRGDHSIGALGIRDRDDRTEVRVFDPLADGRRPGIPAGPRWWPLWLLREAAGAFAGTASRATFGVVPISPKLEPPDPDPEPDPEPDHRAALLTVRNGLLELVAGIDDAVGVPPATVPDPPIDPTPQE